MQTKIERLANVAAALKALTYSEMMELSRKLAMAVQEDLDEKRGKTVACDQIADWLADWSEQNAGESEHPVHRDIRVVKEAATG